MSNDILKLLGLSESEIKIYLSLIGVHSVPASSLARQLQMPRTTVKYCLEQLCQKGLAISINHNNCSHYSPNTPSRLQTLFDAQRHSFEAQSGPLNAMIGNLMQKYCSDGAAPKVQFFEGPEGIVDMLQDVIDSKEKIYGALHIAENMHPTVQDYFTNIYIPKRKSSKKPSWMLFNDNPKTRAYQKEDLAMNRLTLLLPEKEFPFESCMHIYGDKVAFYSYESSFMSGVIVQDSHTHRMQLSLFTLAWNFAKQLPQNEAYRKVELEP